MVINSSSCLFSLNDVATEDCGLSRNANDFFPKLKSQTMLAFDFYININLNRGVGISIMNHDEELIYLRLNDIRMNIIKQKETWQFSCNIRSIQVNIY